MTKRRIGMKTKILRLGAAVCAGLAVCLGAAAFELHAARRQGGVILEAAGLAASRVSEQEREQAGDDVCEGRGEVQSRKGILTEKEAYESPIDFASLFRKNPDIVAWIRIPGTSIDEPVVQAEDNETYLKLNVEGKKDSHGAIFLDCDSEADFSGRHAILYGHHMRDGSRFADLMKFREPEFFREHREAVLYLPDRELRLKTIAAVCADGGGTSGERRRTRFDGDGQFEAYVDEMTKSCRFRELPEETPEALYSFITCSYEFPDARTILYAAPEA